MDGPLLKVDKDFHTPSVPQGLVVASHSEEPVVFFLKRTWKSPPFTWKNKQ